MNDRHYRTLGLDPDATPAEVKRAYRTLARTYHPDLHPGDTAAEARFRDVSLAYEVLSETWPAAPAAAGGRPARAGGADAAREIREELRARFEDMLAELLSSAEGPKPRKGRTLRLDLGLTLEEMARGARKKLSTPSFQLCNACGGRGAKASAAWGACAACSGRGRRRGPRGVLGACPVCFGRGETPLESCAGCAGLGYREGARDLEVAVPAAVGAGVRLRVRGAGLPGVGGAEAGDLVFDVRPLPDPRFALDPRAGHLYGVLALDYVSLLEGTRIEIETPAGPASVPVAPRARAGGWIRLAGKGMPSQDGAGDLFLRLDLAYPEREGDPRALRRALGAPILSVTAAEERPGEREARDA